MFSLYFSPACYTCQWTESSNSSLRSFSPELTFDFLFFDNISQSLKKNTKQRVRLYNTTVELLYCSLKIYLLFRELCFTYSWEVCRLQNLQGQALPNLGFEDQPTWMSRQAALTSLVQRKQQAISLLMMTLRQVSRTPMVPSNFLQQIWIK